MSEMFSVCEVRVTLISIINTDNWLSLGFLLFKDHQPSVEVWERNVSPEAHMFAHLFPGW